MPPSIDASQNPVAFTSLYDLLTRVQSRRRRARPAQYWLFNSRTKKLVAGPNETTRHDVEHSTRGSTALKPLPTVTRRRATPGLLDALTTGRFPTGYAGADDAARHAS